MVSLQPCQDTNVEPRPPSGPPDLTDRQREVARLIEAGYTNERIADELGISVAGAKYHVSELLARLDLSRREEIAQWYRAGARSRARTWFGVTAGAIARGGVVAAGALLAAAAVLLGLTVTGDASPDESPPVSSPSAPVATEEPQDPERDQARRELLAIAGVGDVVEAVEAGDVDRLLDLFVLTSRPCSTEVERSQHDRCSDAGVGYGVPVDTIWMRRSAPHGVDDFEFPGIGNLPMSDRWLPSELRPVLESMIGNSEGTLAFADTREFAVMAEDGTVQVERWYRLGFTTAPIDLAPLGAFQESEVPSDALGLFVLAGAARPIDRFVFLEPPVGIEPRPHLPTSSVRFALDPPPDDLPPERPEVTAMRSELSAIAAVRDALAAAESGDVDAFIAQMRLTERVCFPDSIRHDFDGCVAGNGATADGVYWTAGSDTGFEDGHISVRRVRHEFGALTMQGNTRLDFAGVGTDGRYYLAFMASPVVPYPDSNVQSGFAVIVDPGGDSAVVSFTPLYGTETGADWIDLGYHNGVETILEPTADR